MKIDKKKRLFNFFVQPVQKCLHAKVTLRARMSFRAYLRPIRLKYSKNSAWCEAE